MVLWSKYSTSRLTPTELVASGDGKAAHLCSGGSGYWLCAVLTVERISFPAPELRVWRVCRSDACVE
ncbi:MAG: hypothetical protein ACOVSW_00200 [Candidatus Kapaibacteriota bacterium]